MGLWFEEIEQKKKKTNILHKRNKQQKYVEI